MRKLIFFFTFLFAVNLSAQKQIPPAKVSSINKSAISIKTDHRQQFPARTPDIFNLQTSAIGHAIPFQLPIKESQLHFFKDPENGLPVMISGQLENPNRNADTPSKCFEYLSAVKINMQIREPENEFVIYKQSLDAKGVTHVRMHQHFNGVKVYGGEIILHESEETIFLLNGRYFPTPEIVNLNPAIAKTTAEQIVKSDRSDWSELSQDQHIFIAHEQLKSELVIYHDKADENRQKLVWHIHAIPNITSKWEYFIDAQNGDIIKKFSNICQIGGAHCKGENHEHATNNSFLETKASNPPIFGPETAQATDLQGITRTINVYETGGIYYMIDGSRTMFNAGLSSLPNEPSGVIWSINAFNTSPENSNFNYDHISSGNNTWNNPTAVSAHYNGGLSYEYFKNTFGRESVNGQGGNIISFINVSESDGSSMDNAFWNGAAMFYGNGNQAFNAPLSKALDVAGHEISHGVIQNEANLTYQNESGALNESFADIFGAMIDRDDWKIGEEVANPAIFPSGTMRDMQDPHNGGNSNDFYWQPKHVNEQYQGNEDNGGVHINSGIPNHAYYLFATAIGKNKAEDIYYDVLSNYLVASSQFIDLRFAVVQATTQVYGAGSTEVNAAINAFNAVGIGEGGGDDYQDDIPVNPGNDFICWSDLGLNTINNALTTGAFDGTFSNTNHISRPSLTDDGSIMLFIDANNNMVEVDINWSTGQIENEFIIEGSGIWRNVATSKDGSKLAAITTANNNEIFVFDFNSNSSFWFELYNPTTADGVSTGDVVFPDVLEWDFSGQYVLYDALNVINGQTSNIEYWDIGFTKVWDLASNDFGSGTVSKLFSGLPSNVSIGNPAFSKNSPYIIAFDFIENTNQGTNYEVLGVNIQTGDQGSIWQNNTLGYPSYSVDDNEIIFTTFNNNQKIIAISEMENDKVNGVGEAFILIENAEWATWFATGQRDLNVSTFESAFDSEVKIYPNPVDHTLVIEWTDNNFPDAAYQCYDMMGKLIKSGSINHQREELDVSTFASGTYFLNLFDGKNIIVKKIIVH